MNKQDLIQIIQEETTKFLLELGPEIIDPIQGVETPFIKRAQIAIEDGDKKNFNDAIEWAKSLGVGQGAVALTMLASLKLIAGGSASAASTALTTGTVTLRELPLIHLLFKHPILSAYKEALAKISLWVYTKTGSKIAAEGLFNYFLVYKPAEYLYNWYAWAQNKPTLGSEAFQWLKKAFKDTKPGPKENEDMTKNLLDRWNGLADAGPKGQAQAAKEIQQLEELLKKIKEQPTKEASRQDLIQIIQEEVAAVLDEKKKKKKKAGTESGKENNLRDWFKRKGAKGKKGGWVDCNTCRTDKKTGRKKCKACGRSSGEKRSKYPSCRPTPGACGERGRGKSWGKKSARGKK